MSDSRDDHEPLAEPSECDPAPAHDGGNGVDVDAGDSEAAARVDPRRSLKRPRVDNPHNATEETELSGPAETTFAQALATLNARFVASLRERIQFDPASDLSPWTQDYEENVRRLRATFASPAIVASALQELETAFADEQEEAEQEPTQSSSGVSFVASSDAAEMGERELEPDEVYFGASLDVDAVSSSNRSEFVSFASDGAIANPDEIDSDALDGGFLTTRSVPAMASVWNDPELQRLRVPSDQMQVHGLLSSTDHAENWRGACGQTPVVLKRLARNAQTMANAVSFALHIKSVASLQHPHLVSVVGVAWDKALDVQVATEWMERGDLRSLLDSSTAAAMTWTEGKCQVAIEIAEAIAYIHTHTQRALASPLTSRKILFDASGTAKLHLISSMCGSTERVIPWTAPEVLRAEPRSLQADVYTLGVLLTELDTTASPYSSVAAMNGVKLEPSTLARSVATGELAPSLTPTCPPSIAAIVGQCLAFDPTQRPEAQRIAYALREALKNDL